MKVLIKNILMGQELTAEFAEEIMRSLVHPDAFPEHVGAILALLSQRPLQSKELLGFTRPLLFPYSGRSMPQALDVCGTGGDGLSTVNVSTAVAFVVASGGVTVVKHGNRSVSSRCGSIDVLQSLGISISQSLTDVDSDVAKFGLSFLFAPAFHPTLARLAPLRKSLGFRTFLNVLGPLINPCAPGQRVVGVYSEELLMPVAEVLRDMGCLSAMVVHAEDGMDEVSLNSKTHVVFLKDGRLNKKSVDHADFGLPKQSLDGVRGGTAEDNARILQEIFQGAKGAATDVVAANAAAAFMVAGATPDLISGVQLAKELLFTGKTARLVQQMMSVRAL